MVVFLMSALVKVDPPSGNLSPLAWVLVLALVGAIGTVCTVALRWISKLYEDLKACNAARAASEEDILAMLRVARSQMERSKGGSSRCRF